MRVGNEIDTKAIVCVKYGCVTLSAYKICNRLSSNVKSINQEWVDAITWWKRYNGITRIVIVII